MEGNDTLAGPVHAQDPRIRKDFDLSIICSSNGLDPELTDTWKDVVTLECILMGLSGLEFLRPNFSNLTELCIIGHPEISSLSGVQDCVTLNILWVCETSLAKIDCLRNCSQIRQLYLYSNKIQKIENLDFLDELEYLDLHDNQIGEASGFSGSPNLTNLNLSQNQIECLGAPILDLQRLEVLDLTGNMIASLKDIQILSIMPKLCDLSFSNEDGMANPLCDHPEYPMCVHRLLPDLVRFDLIDIKADTLCRRLEHDWDYGQFWCNIRMWTLARLLDNAMRNEVEATTELLASKQMIISAVERSKQLNLVDIETSVQLDELYDRTAKVMSNRLKNHQLHHELLSCLERISAETTGSIRYDVGSPISSWHALCLAFLEKSVPRVDQNPLKILNIIRVHSETASRLRTNIIRQLCDAPARVPKPTKTGNGWVAKDGKGGSGILYEDSGNEARSQGNEDLVFAHHGSYQDSVWSNVDELSRVILTGFDYSDHSFKSTLNGFDSQQSFGYLVVAKKWTVTKKGSRLTNLLEHEALAIPLFIVQIERKVDIDFNVAAVPPNIKDGAESYYKFAETARRNLCANNDYISFFKTMSNTADLNLLTYLNLHRCQLESLPDISKLIHLTDCICSFNDLVNLRDFSSMPNLVVLDVSFNKINNCFDLQDSPKISSIDLHCNRISNPHMVHKLASNCPLIKCIDIRFNPLWSDSAFAAIDELRSEYPGVEVSHNGLHKSLQRPGSKYECSKRFHFQPTITANLIGESSDHTRIAAVSIYGRQSLNQLSLSDFPNLSQLCVKNAGCETVPGIEFCNGLKELRLEFNFIHDLIMVKNLGKITTLNLRNNEISDLSGLEGLSCLVYLNLDNNRVSNLAPISSLEKLESLMIAANCLESPREVLRLRRNHSLRFLGAQSNPVCLQFQNFRLFVLYYLDNLIVVDGVQVSDSEMKAAVSCFDGVLTLNYLLDELGDDTDIRSITRIDLPEKDLTSVMDFPSISSLTAINLQGNSLTEFGIFDVLPSLEVLCLAGNKIKSVGGLLPKAGDIFLKLQVLDLSWNSIPDLELLYLSRFPSLTSLFLQHNSLTDTRWLHEIPKLQYLVLDNNRIKGIFGDTLSTCQRLTELHLMNNRITSLESIPEMKRLERLRLGSNRIGNLVGLNMLSSCLPLLVDLNLSGNLCTRSDSYRSEVVLALPSVRIVDSNIVSAEELQVIKVQQIHQGLLLSEDMSMESSISFSRQ